MTDSIPFAAAWHARGTMRDVHGLRVFTVTGGDLARGVPVLFLHGFPSSSLDWHRLEPLLGDRPRIFFDFPGYGYSAKPEAYSYSLFEQADVAEGLLRLLGVGEVDVVAHDMGTSVACELAARSTRGLLSFRMRSLVLMNGSVRLELASLTPSQKLLRTRLGPFFARLSSRPVFKAQIRRILAQPVPDEELEAMWLLLKREDGVLRLPRIIRYLEERVRFADRWIGALGQLDFPLGLVWGLEDPVAVPAIAERLARDVPGSVFMPLPHLGHYPQLENPDAVFRALQAYWEHGK